MDSFGLIVISCIVALRKESVDRNDDKRGTHMKEIESLSARRAWIEMRTRTPCFPCLMGRSPQGERG